MANFDPAVTKTILREGGSKITNDPADPGGVTKYGIAQAYHPGVDVRNLTEDGAKAIYRDGYWTPLRGDEITSQGVAEMLFDAGVNLGLGTTLKLAQVALGLPQTGKMDDATLEALNAAPATEFAAAFTLAKIARYVHLCAVKPEKRKFFFGWIKRALEGAA